MNHIIKQFRESHSIREGLAMDQFGSSFLCLRKKEKVYKNIRVIEKKKKKKKEIKLFREKEKKKKRIT